MRAAALFVHGRIVVGVNHGDAFGKLTQEEKCESFVSGFYDEDTCEFNGEEENQHFYNKQICMIRHGHVKDKNNPDTDLSDHGIKKVKEAAQIISDNFDIKNSCGITSPLLRCLRTSQIIQELTGIEFAVNSELMETPPIEFHLKNHKQNFLQFKWDTSYDWDLIPEEPPVFAKRIKNALNNIPNNSIIVTHMGTICNILKIAYCENKARQIMNGGLEPASITLIKKQEVEKYANFGGNRSANKSV